MTVRGLNAKCPQKRRRPVSGVTADKLTSQIGAGEAFAGAFDFRRPRHQPETAPRELASLPVWFVMVEQRDSAAVLLSTVT